MISFRDVAQSEEGRAGFGASQQGADNSYGGHSYSVGDSGDGDSHGGGYNGDMVIMIKRRNQQFHAQVVDLEEGGEESPEW